MEDLKHKRNLGKFVASCNAPPSSVQVKICRETESNVNAEVRSGTEASGNDNIGSGDRWNVRSL